ncbi:Hypothetical_protein [Hexamita inflata]|uniref:Hypothetical_protein n=1 Tax=Hexamita inflata TaxID=28002 RepID=A0AA86TLN0_9EUKA|nr:Hypothetical protein HINF_LOCUS9989 [Hexamita inflata]
MKYNQCMHGSSFPYKKCLMALQNCFQHLKINNIFAYIDSGVLRQLIKQSSHFVKNQYSHSTKSSEDMTKLFKMLNQAGQLATNHYIRKNNETGKNKQMTLLVILTDRDISNRGRDQEAHRTVKIPSRMLHNRIWRRTKMQCTNSMI